MSKILVIEDDELMHKIIEKILRRENIEMDAVLNGKEAINKLIENDYDYDLILTDIMMPYANGLEILSKVKNREVGRSIAVMIISNASNEEMITDAFKLGADDFLKKPFAPNELLMRVKRLVGKK
ncbi:MAG TPA: response regulator transcription factor [Arachidicoccus soli]|nr:response regulator transcription factor [Arachidicoccus soli]